MAAIPKIDVDPDAHLDYGRDWADWLQPGEVIVGVEVITVEPAIVVSSSFVLGTASVAWASTTVSGRLTFRITTNEGRIDDRSVLLSVKER